MNENENENKNENENEGLNILREGDMDKFDKWYNDVPEPEEREIHEMFLYAQGNYPILEKLLFMYDDDGTTMMWECRNNGNLDIFKLAIDNSTYINARCPAQCACIASMYDNREIVEYLFEENFIAEGIYRVCNIIMHGNLHENV